MTNPAWNIAQYLRRHEELKTELEVVEDKMDKLEDTYIEQYAKFKGGQHVRTWDNRRGEIDGWGTTVDWEYLEDFEEYPEEPDKGRPNDNPSGIMYRLRMIKKATGEETGKLLNSGYKYKEGSLKAWE